MSEIAHDLRSASSGSGREKQNDFASSVRAQTDSYVLNRKTDAAKAISEIAESIRESGTGFASLPHVKALFDSAAEGVDEFSDGIKRRSFSELYDEVEAAVRRRPGMTAAVAGLAGFALFRFFKASEVRSIPRSRSVVVADVFPTSEI